MEIEKFFHIKLMQQNGGVNGGRLTVMELFMTLCTSLKLVLKYCDTLKHIVSTGSYATTKHGVFHDTLYRFQDEMLNKLPKSIDLLKDCTKKCVKGGFGYAVCSDKLYLIIAQMLVKLYLIHYIMHITMGPFEDDLTEIDRILDSVSQAEFRLLNKIREVCPTEWDEVLELFITLDTDDDLQIFTPIAGFNTGV